MSQACPRIAIFGMHLESNAFAPVSTAHDFRSSCYFVGQAMLDSPEVRRIFLGG